jgi:predicted transport protein
MLTNEDIKLWLKESGVANELGHYENGELHTAITSLEELTYLIELAYYAGETDGRR